MDLTKKVQNLQARLKKSSQVNRELQPLTAINDWQNDTLQAKNEEIVELKALCCFLFVNVPEGWHWEKHHDLPKWLTRWGLGWDPPIPMKVVTKTAKELREEQESLT